MNAVKFNEYASVVVSAGYDQSLRAWDCRSRSTEPIQVFFFFGLSPSMVPVNLLMLHGEFLRLIMLGVFRSLTHLQTV